MVDHIDLLKKAQALRDNSRKKLDEELSSLEEEMDATEPHDD